jgi:hypothetical protein
MKDIRERIEKLLIDAKDCDLIGRLATVPEKREAFKMAHELETIAISGVIPDDQQK